MPGSNALGLNSSTFERHTRHTATAAVDPVEVAMTQKATAIAAGALATPLPVVSCGDDVRIAFPRRTLFLWNVAMTLFHASLAAATFAIGNPDLTVPIYRTDIEFVVTAEGADGEQAWELRPLFVRDGELAFTFLVASFFLLSCFFHLLNCI